MSTKTRVHRFEDVIGYLQQEHRLHLLHFAVDRTIYMHHFIVLGHTWSDDLECCQIVHFSSVAQSSSGEVRQDTYYKTDFENDIENGLFHFSNENYPKTNEQYQQAYLRLRRRLENNDNYSISANNCEHLVYHILTGNPFSSQVNEGSFVKRYFMDFFDDGAIKETIKSTLINGSLRILFSRVFSKYIKDKTTELLEKEPKRGIINRIIDILVMYYKKTILRTSEREILEPVEKTLMSCLRIDPYKVSKCQKAITYIRKIAKHYRFYITFVTLLLTSITVIIHNIIRLKSLSTQRRNGIINPTDYRREKIKIMLSNVTILLLSMSYFRWDYTNIWTVLLETCIVMISRHVMSTFLINILGSNLTDVSQ